MNTTILPTTLNKLWVKMEKASINDVKEILLKNEYISAIGHESTAQLLSQLLNINVNMNRVNVDLKINDIALCFKTKHRAIEGKVYTLQELKQLEYDFFIIYTFDMSKLLDDIAKSYNHQNSYNDYKYENII